MTKKIFRTIVDKVEISIDWVKHHGYRLRMYDTAWVETGSPEYPTDEYYAKLSSAVAAAARVIKKLGK
jgi:hypothetical protein